MSPSTAPQYVARICYTRVVRTRPLSPNQPSTDDDTPAVVVIVEMEHYEARCWQ